MELGVLVLHAQSPSHSPKMMTEMRKLDPRGIDEISRANSI